MSAKRKTAVHYPPMIPPEDFARLIAGHYPLADDLNGRHGTNRVTETSEHLADTDLDAVNAWLAEYRDSPATLINYSKEIHRLYVWAIAGSGKSLSSLSRNDLSAYFDFLRDPQPADAWCGRPCPKVLADQAPNPAWRPLNSGLSTSSIATAQVILSSLFQWLVDAEYLRKHPLALVRRRRGKLSVGSEAPKPQRVFDVDMEVAIQQAVDLLPQDTLEQRRTYERARWVIALLLYSGLRRSELQSHTMANIRRIDDHWWIELVGKGGRRRAVPVPQVLLEALMRFRGFLGLSALPTGADQTPLVPTVRAGRGGLETAINSRQINQVIKPIVWAAADILEEDFPQKAAYLRASSPHWFRHTYATTLLAYGADPKVVQTNLGHASFNTTALYQHVQTDGQHRATTDALDKSTDSHEP